MKLTEAQKAKAADSRRRAGHPPPPKTTPQDFANHLPDILARLRDILDNNEDRHERRAT